MCFELKISNPPRPSSTEGHSGTVPPKRKLCPPSEDSAPKKLTGSGLLECKSRPETPKLVLIALEFASKNCFFVVFVDAHRISCYFGEKTFLFLVFTVEFVENRKNFEMNEEFVKIFELNTFFFVLLILHLIHTLEFT